MPSWSKGSHHVLCREDADEDGLPGKYVLATTRVLNSKDDAIRFAFSVSPSRFPIVVQTVWTTPNHTE